MKYDLLRVATCVVAMSLWWGYLYPELMMTPDTYVIIAEENTVQDEQNVIECSFGDDIYFTLMETDPSKIVFKSKLVEQADVFFKHLKQHIEKKDDVWK